eukprot:CAMPEP_0113547256 /NCGR_PEP_ID=MMETSP0015_2-20120614/12254_1 /TAXON_ID=2838 /ORGANISM="Odontella" /LENGTH=984 /DNA_ID=CAMNT_0000447789 /DNA_START=9 /DNA_END=2963 /DNA_ORIENTATION=+ /assembly_acc=CAM_ASM_000160
MTQEQAAVNQLRTVLSQTLSPDAAVRRSAERHLDQAKKQPGHPLHVLRIVASSDVADASVRQAAAVHFKNIVKKGWDEDAEHGTDGIVISSADRRTIKSHLVELMCTVPPQIQAQCSESISLVAKVDFPSKWDNLLPELIQKFNSPDPNIVSGVLVTINAILRRFRYVQRSDDLYRDILYVLERLQAPLLTLFKTTGKAVDALANDPAQLKPRFASLRSVCRIFYSLNWQDLPEYFEDHMAEWMEEFAKYLNYRNPALEDEDEETEPSPVDVLQSAIVENLNLYANKDEEPFLPFLPNFTTLVWNRLMALSSFPKHDTLATTSIRFLSSLVGKLMHKSLFQDPATLREIIVKIVIPNIMIREADEERFEDDPQEFILGDMEGSDTESRRKVSQELLRAMCRQFEAETTSICSEHVGTMLAEFSADPAGKWTAKDAAIHLVLGIAIRAESTAHGVSQVNDSVNVMEFFTSHILTELQETDMTKRPMVKATAIKFVSTFRNQFVKEHLVALMPLLISHLPAESVVVHTYAAAAIEKILTTKDEAKRHKLGSAELGPFLESLFGGLFGIVDNAVLNENEYVMKCIMRSLNVAKDDLLAVTQIVLDKLTGALGRVAKNPRNPQYNHYMFESIAVLVRSVCAKHPEHTSAFESLLFPPFQVVLQMDVTEFTPYVFQVLAQLLEYRPADAGLGEAYTSLFAPLLTPTLWERKGNIPALTRLVRAYLGKGAAEIVGQGHLVGILGVFQKLISSRANETSAFELLGSIVAYIPVDTYRKNLRDIFQILLMRLQQAKTPRYTRLVTDFFALYVGKFGSQAYLDQLNAIQPGLGLMLLTQVWTSRLAADLPVRMEAKVQVIGLTKVLCETPALLSDPSAQQIWTQALAGVMKIIINPNGHIGGAAGANAADDDDFEVEIGYDATYSRLHFAARPAVDVFPEVKDPALTLAQSLHALCSSQPGKFPPLIQHGLQSDPKLSAGLESLFQKAGLRIV